MIAFTGGRSWIRTIASLAALLLGACSATVDGATSASSSGAASTGSTAASTAGSTGGSSGSASTGTSGPSASSSSSSGTSASSGTSSSSASSGSTASSSSGTSGTSGTSGSSGSTGSVGRSYPRHTHIVSTTFWVGELFNASLADGSQVCSTYDSEWAFHWSGINAGTVPSSAAGCAGSIYGGCDGVTDASYSTCQTEARTAANNYFPTSVPTPLENPFYLDLPFDDLNDATAFAERCQVIPWASDPGYAGHCSDTNFSYMKNRWVKITGPNGHVCYGQIEDAGPSHGSLYHDANYVFGSNDAQPVQGQFNNAGADVSPALNGCLGFAEVDGDMDQIEWEFVDDVDVPPGPWTRIVTHSGVTQ